MNTSCRAAIEQYYTYTPLHLLQWFQVAISDLHYYFQLLTLVNLLNCIADNRCIHNYLSCPKVMVRRRIQGLAFL